MKGAIHGGTMNWPFLVQEIIILTFVRLFSCLDFSCLFEGMRVEEHIKFLGGTYE